MAKVKRIDLGKSPTYYKLLKFGLITVAGFIIVTNAHFTVKGLASLPRFPDWVAWGVGIGMVIVESAVTTTVFSGDFQESVIGLFDEDDDEDSDGDDANFRPRSDIGRSASFAFKLLSVVAGLCIIGFLYYFDYTSTYQGLHGPGVPASGLTVLTTLFLNFGNEAAAFLSPIIDHQHRRARIRNAKNKMASEPEAIRSEHELRKAIARVRKEVDEDVNGHGKPAGRGNRGVYQYDD